MRLQTVLSAGVGAAIATALVGGIAWAGIPGGDGVIHGCYQKAVGQLRVIDPDTGDCRPSEIAITWNEQGAKGEKGQPGSAGRDGLDGLDGTDVTVAPEPPSPNCFAGGARLSAANGVVYVCSGFLGEPDPGPD